MIKERSYSSGAREGNGARKNRSIKGRGSGKLPTRSDAWKGAESAITIRHSSEGKGKPKKNKLVRRRRSYGEGRKRVLNVIYSGGIRTICKPPS